MGGKKTWYDPVGLFTDPEDIKPPPIPPPPTPPEEDNDKAAKAKQAAALKAKKAAASAYGYEDTVLTGSLGLGDIPSQYQGGKTLLGS